MRLTRPKTRLAEDTISVLDLLLTPGFRSEVAQWHTGEVELEGGKVTVSGTSRARKDPKPAKASSSSMADVAGHRPGICSFSICLPNGTLSGSASKAEVSDQQVPVPAGITMSLSRCVILLSLPIIEF